MTFSLSLINRSLALVFIYLEAMYSKYNLCKIQFVRKRNHIETSVEKHSFILELNTIRHFCISIIATVFFLQHFASALFSISFVGLCKASDLNVFNIHSIEVLFLDCLKH